VSQKLPKQNKKKMIWGSLFAQFYDRVPKPLLFASLRKKP